MRSAHHVSCKPNMAMLLVLLPAGLVASRRPFALAVSSDAFVLVCSLEIR